MSDPVPPADTLDAILDQEIGELVRLENAAEPPQDVTGADPGLTHLETAVLHLSDELAALRKLQAHLAAQMSDLENLIGSASERLKWIAEGIRLTRT